MSPHARHRSRRHFLRAAGLTLSLPWLESLGRGGLCAATTPTPGSTLPARLICIYAGNGVCNESWYPQQTGSEYTLSPSLMPLQRLQKHFSILSRLSHMHIYGNHTVADSWLTAAQIYKNGPGQYSNSVSVDQVAAKHCSSICRFSSLQLGSGGTGRLGQTATVSYNLAGMPLPTMRANQAFERMFVQEDSASIEEQRRRLHEKSSILDDVQAQTASLMKTVNARDKQRMEQYLTSVRETELQIQRTLDWLDKPKPEVDPVQLSKDKQEAMFDVMRLAITTDSTRVISYAMELEGAKGKGHDNSHHGGNAKRLAGLAKRDHGYAELLARFLGQLAETEEGEGNLLGRTMVLFGSGLNNGTRDLENGTGAHDHINAATLLAGGSELGLKHGQHLRFEDATNPYNSVPLSNLFVTLLEKIGIAEPSFLHASGPLQGLT